MTITYTKILDIPSFKQTKYKNFPTNWRLLPRLRLQPKNLWIILPIHYPWYHSKAKWIQHIQNNNLRIQLSKLFSLLLGVAFIPSTHIFFFFKDCARYCVWPFFKPLFDLLLCGGSERLHGGYLWRQISGRVNVPLVVQLISYYVVNLGISTVATLEGKLVLCLQIWLNF